MKTLLNTSLFNVGMSEMIISCDKNSVLVSQGLGSCLGVTFYDPERSIASLSHIVLPDSSFSNRSGQPGKYVDTAIVDVLQQFRKFGSKKEKLIIKAAGGANMLNLNLKSNACFNIGERNFSALLNVLAKHRLSLASYDVGGKEGRTIKILVADGTVSVRKIAKEEKII